MQELRSTEILDKEIHADAVKKAEKILQKADVECNKIISSLKENLQQAKAEREAVFNKKIEALKKDQTSAIPLEERRFEVSFIQNALINNINEYLKSISQEKRLSLLMKDFSNIKESVKDKKLNALYYGFDEKTVKPVLEKELGKNLVKCEKTEFGKYIQEDDFLELKEGVILETEDKSFRCRLTLSQVINQLLEKHRAELSDILFGVTK